MIDEYLVTLWNREDLYIAIPNPEGSVGQFLDMDCEVVKYHDTVERDLETARVLAFPVYRNNLGIVIIYRVVFAALLRAE